MWVWDSGVGGGECFNVILQVSGIWKGGLVDFDHRNRDHVLSWYGIF